MNTNHVSELWKASLVFGPIFAVLFSVPTYSSFVGFTKYDECPFQPFLPQGLIGFGILGSICSILALILIIISFFKTDDSGTQLYYLVYSIAAVAAYSVSAILLAFAIAYVLHTKYPGLQSENPNNPETFCHSSVYNFCHGFSAIFIGLTLIFIIWLIWYFSNEIYKFLEKKQSTQKTR